VNPPGSVASVPTSCFQTACLAVLRLRQRTQSRLGAPHWETAVHPLRWILLGVNRLYKSAQAVPESDPTVTGESADSQYSLEVIVVTYFSWINASDELTQMVELANSRPRIRWIFLDNSSDGSDAAQLRMASGQTDNIRIVELRDNPGFAAGCNRGVSMSHADWVFCLNPDITITEQDLDRIESGIRQVEADSIAVSQVTRGLVHAGVGMTRYQWFTDRPLGSTMPLLGPSGGAGLYRRASFVALGGFFEALFAWGEDADLALRLTHAGSRCAELDLRLNHQGQHSVAGSKAARSFKARLLTRNRIWVAARNLPRWRVLMFVIVHACVIILLTPRNISRGTVKATWYGYRDGLQLLDESAQIIERKREPHRP
jgi:N-acetylglucosaminyl-diphospho-decaprenol L-rhamnosyltransferase